WYFLTLCLQNRECRFGEIKNAQMILNSAGRFVDKWWKKIPGKFPNSQLDVYRIMPNHFHGIVEITDPDKTADADPRFSTDKTVGVDLRVNPNREDDHNLGGHVGPPQPESPQPGLPQSDSNQPGTNPKTVGADPR